MTSPLYMIPRTFTKQTECSYCGSPGEVCENPYCQASKGGTPKDLAFTHEVPVVLSWQQSSAKVTVFDPEREAILEANHLLALQRDEIQRLRDHWGFRRGSKELKTLKANDKAIIAEMTRNQVRLNALKAKRMVV